MKAGQSFDLRVRRKCYREVFEINLAPVTRHGNTHTGLAFIYLYDVVREALHKGPKGG